MFVLMGVTLYTSRVVLNVLGVEKYGVWNLIAGVVVLFSFVQNAMATAIQRYVSFYIGRDDIRKTHQVLYNSKTILAYFSIAFLLICETIGLYFVNSYLNIPHELIWETNLLYQLIILNTIVLIFKIPYDAWIIAHEKMSFYSVSSLIEGSGNLIIVFILSILPGASLFNYGILTLFVSISMLIWYSLYCKYQWNTKVFCFLHERSVFKELFSFSGYTMLGSISSILSTQGLQFLLNIFFSVSVNAAMGIAQQVNGAVYKFITNFQTAFKPQIVKLYSSENNKELQSLIYLASRISFYMMWVIACPLLINIDTILEIWLNNVPQYTSGLCVLMIICSLIECISSPLWMTIQATGKIKLYQYTISITNICVILLSFILLNFWKNVNAVLISKLIIDIIVLAERLFFSEKLFNLSVYAFLGATVIKNIFISVITFFICYYFHTVLFSQKELYLIAFDVVFSCIFNFIVIYSIGLNRNEKSRIKNLVKKKINI